MEDSPPNLKSAAILQIVSGLLNVFIVAPIASGVVGTFCGALTFGLGGLCAFIPCMLAPVGILEIISGGVALANPRSGGKMLQLTMYVEMASFLLGGLLSGVAGGVVMSLMRDDEVTRYLEG